MLIELMLLTACLVERTCFDLRGKLKGLELRKLVCRLACLASYDSGQMAFIVGKYGTWLLSEASEIRKLPQTFSTRQ